jgi:RimJ/RimL family protein N-acetyltransferase
VGVHRVELHVDPENAGSRRVAERAGFRTEGLIRQRFLHRGRPSDVVLYALLASDPRPEVRAPTE